METYPFSLTAEEVLARFGTSKDIGLTREQARKLQEQFGPNKLPEKKKSIVKTYFAPLYNLMTLILFAAATINLILYAYTQYTPEIEEQDTLMSALLIFVVVFFNFLMSIFQTFRAQRALAALRKLTAFKVTVIRDGEKKRIDSDEIVRGDLLSLATGDYVGADARVLSATEFRVDESMFTGESMSVKKNPAPVQKPAPSIQYQENMVFMGTFVVAGEAKVVVTGIGIATEIGKIAENLRAPEEKEVPLQRKMNKLAKWLGIMVLIAIGVMLVSNFVRLTSIGAFSADQVANSIELAAALAVAAIPVNFPIMTTLILLRGVISLAQAKVIVRKLDAIESLGRISVICSDKTGTITQNEMTIQKIWTADRIFNVTGIGFAPEGQILANGTPIEMKQNPLLKRLIKASMANNAADITTEQRKLHKQKKPGTIYKVIGEATEGAFLVLGLKAGYDLKKFRLKYPMEKTFPFSSERKRSTVISTHKGIVNAFMKGAVEVVTERCTQICVNGQPSLFSDEWRQKVNEATQTFASVGMRTLAVAWKKVPGVVTDIPEAQAESDLILLGIVGMVDPPREGVKDAVISCQNAGIKITMITGDHPTTAAAIAQQIGIYKPDRDAILAGSEIASSPAEKIVKTTVFARVAPNDKELIVSRFQEAGLIVAMTGDGVNDALALEKADAGVAMGVSGTDVAKNAADIILGDDSFATIEVGVFQGRGIFKNIRSCIVYLLTGNLVELLLLFLAQVFFTDPINPLEPLAFFTASQLLYFYITVHFFPILGLMFDKLNRQDLMSEPPKPVKEGLVNRNFLLMLAIQTGTIFCMVIFAFLIGLTSGSPETSLSRARTLALLTLVINESIVAFNVRTERKSIGRSGFNIFLVFFVGFTIITAYLITVLTLGQELLGVTPLTVADWAVAILLSVPVILFVELYKRYLRKRSVKENPSEKSL